jgi:hypothetical protein
MQMALAGRTFFSASGLVADISPRLNQNVAGGIIL